MSDQEDWKQRYLSEARDWESADKLLRKVATRLAMAAEGYSKSLDPVLSRIQEHVRGGDVQPLKADLDELSRQIKRLDTAQSSPEAVPELAAEVVQSSGIAGAGDVREVLLTLVDELSVTQPGVGGFETLRETIQSDRGSNWHRLLDRLIGEIRGLIQRISGDKQALEQLMRDVGAELGGISQVLGDEHSGLQEGRQQALEMRDIMQAGVQRIQTHIESESDIEKLKAGVSQSMDSIRKGIADFVEKDAERFSRSEARNEELRERIVKMEEETEQLQQKLNKNREKLMRDTLTGARSRLAYDETLAREMGRYRRYRETFCLVVLDIDFFKRVNDDFGHAAGDKALQLVGSIIGERIRATDSVFRVGGEEFVLLLPGTSADAAVPLVEAVRQAVGDSGFHFENKPVPITLSAGLTAVRDDDTAETLFARADDAMYRAKKAGRDQLVSLD